MTSRIQQSQTQTEKQDLVVRKKAESRKEHELQDGLVVAEDRRSITETKCSEYNEYVDQAAYLERSWKPNDVVSNSETTTTTSPSETTITTSPSETATTTSPFIEPSFSFKQSHNNSIPQSSPAITHQTIEMELIYEMRGHMEQLHHEIMDLRKSIKSCVNMQVKLQHSFKQNVGAAATHSAADQRIDRKPSGIVQHNCSICYDAQVDSLLYRCGHMCTCFDCAMELKRTGEECPVCESPILDVVKAMRS
ncbi:uncharacterized protein LOC143571704 [Bidens hawaiensis]|uniref:uncharacterized protein LOC143571704 n=1 Tax=Bidens hawaiensis TaxID=980011 RepID=UPI00404B1A47